MLRGGGEGKPMTVKLKFAGVSRRSRCSNNRFRQQYGTVRAVISPDDRDGYYYILSIRAETACREARVSDSSGYGTRRLARVPGGSIPSISSRVTLVRNVFNSPFLFLFSPFLFFSPPFFFFMSSANRTDRVCRTIVFFSYIYIHVHVYLYYIHREILHACVFVVGTGDGFNGNNSRRGKEAPDLRRHAVAHE